MRTFIVTFLLISGLLKAQNNNLPPWQTIQTGIDNISFSLPSVPYVVDSVKYKFFNLGEDTSTSFKVMILKDLPVANGPVYETLIDAMNTKDSIQIIAADSILYQGKICLDGEMEYPSPNGGRYKAYFRYVYYDDKLLNFLIAGPIGDAMALLQKKNQFFSTVGL